MADLKMDKELTVTYEVVCTGCGCTDGPTTLPVESFLGAIREEGWPFCANCDRIMDLHLLKVEFAFDNTTVLWKPPEGMVPI